MRLRNLFTVTLLGAVVAWPSASDAQSVPPSFVTFSDFIASVSNASAQGFLGQSGMGVASEAAFEEMRSHVLKMYQQVLVTHSFLLDAQYFDCIPIEQQPSLRLLGLNAIAVPPLSPPAVGGVSNTPSSLELGLSDPFGNKIQCAAGTIPMRRITLEEVARRKTLSDYFKKSPNEPPLFGPPPGGTNNFEYSIERLNLTPPLSPVIFAATNLNVWNPSVAGDGPFAHSLSQVWMFNTGQTAEAGWQVSVDHYHTTNSVLFIYWTANDYNGTGCYNLECPAFVQTNNQVVLGAPNWSSASVSGGQQVWYDVEWFRDGSGNWWLFHGCDNITSWSVLCPIGYYPASIYSSAPGNPPMLPTSANVVQFGGEVYSGNLGVSYPQMGSGYFTSAGQGYAAFQSGLCFEDITGKAYCGATFAGEVFLPCYSLQCASAPCTAQSFSFGGPGGHGC